mmetsp:Transcript_27734/g.89272  ORF Transcript_27734/g.89272 Transcript_27734/m.89272 type:complete len:205 (-) Transcript_27734:681-1295(-)
MASPPSSRRSRPAGAPPLAAPGRIPCTCRDDPDGARRHSGVPPFGDQPCLAPAVPLCPPRWVPAHRTPSTHGWACRHHPATRTPPRPLLACRHQRGTHTSRSRRRRTPRPLCTPQRPLGARVVQVPGRLAALSARVGHAGPADGSSRMPGDRHGARQGPSLAQNPRPRACAHVPQQPRPRPPRPRPSPDLRSPPHAQRLRLGTR